MLEEFEKTRIKTGFKEVMNLISENNAERVYVAEDCDESLKDKIIEAAAAAGMSVEGFPTMKELGKACKIDVGASCAAVIR